MSQTASMPVEITPRDYSLIGRDTKLAEERGLADAQWYACSIPRQRLQDLMRRRDGPAIRDTLIWFSGLIIAGALGYWLWGSWWAIFPFAVYGVLYGSASDSRWHECSHRTAFKTVWMNDVIYEIASFMVLRESVPWRWSHTRHHTDTIIVGRDPEIAVPRPPDLLGISLSFFALKSGPKELWKMLLHCCGRLTPAEATYVPDVERHKVYRNARIYVSIYAAVIGWAIAIQSILPLMYIGLPSFYGAWLMVVFGLTQHAGLAEDVLDHRLNCRTVYMNPLFRFIYWEMNYHVEHHMFPMVPYHALGSLHRDLKEEMPKPYEGLWETYREIIPTLLRQVKDPGYYARRRLPPSAKPINPAREPPRQSQIGNGRWIEACEIERVKKNDVFRFDHRERTFAIYRTADDRYYATDGLCTHGKVHLAGGFVMDNIIECPKHNGRFDFTTGEAKGAPACVNLKTYPVKLEEGRVFLNLPSE